MTTAAVARTTFKDKTPLKTLAKASQSCTVQSAAYAKCIGAKYLEVSKGMCEAEFQEFKQCVQVSVCLLLIRDIA